MSAERKAIAALLVWARSRGHKETCDRAMYETRDWRRYPDCTCGHEALEDAADDFDRATTHPNAGESDADRG